MSFLLILLLPWAFSLSSHKPPEKKPQRSYASEVTFIEETPLQSTPAITIHPRPSINPNFSGPENNICYNYGNLLVRNNMAHATDPIVADKEKLLKEIYRFGKIIIHHTATEQTPAQVIRAAITGRGWSDVGYHFMIDHNGRITEGRSLLYMGANAGQIPNRSNDCGNDMYYMDKDNDYRSIGIALLGNFDLYSPAQAQMKALKDLIQYLTEKFDIIEVKPHKHYKATNCPGKFFMSQHQDVFDDVTEEEVRRVINHVSPFVFNPDFGIKRPICYSCQ